MKNAVLPKLLKHTADGEDARLLQVLLQDVSLRVPRLAKVRKQAPPRAQGGRRRAGRRGRLEERRQDQHPMHQSALVQEQPGLLQDDPDPRRRRTHDHLLLVHAVRPPVERKLSLNATRVLLSK